MPDQMTLQQFGQTIKSKHPEYADMADEDVGGRVLQKFPQYHDMVLPAGATGQLPGVPNPKPDLNYAPAVDSPTGLLSGAWSGVKSVVMHPVDTVASMGQPFQAAGVAPGGMYPTTAATSRPEDSSANSATQQQALTAQGRQGNYAAAHPFETIGSVAGPALLTAGVTKMLGGVPRVAGALKDGLTIPDDVHAASSAYDSATDLHKQAAAVPDAADTALAGKKVAQSNAEALPELHTRLSKVLDSKAAEIGADTSSMRGLSDKAHAAGEAWKGAAKSDYAKLDDAAARATGKSGTFQRLQQAVNKYKDQLAEPGINGVEEQDINDRLAAATSERDAFVSEAEAAGIQNVHKFVKAADAKYSQGLSIQEFGRGLANNEQLVPGPSGTISRELIPNARPLNNAVRQVSSPAKPRGHVLKQGFGEQTAGEIQRAAADAAERIKQDRATVDAAKARSQAVKDSAADAKAQLGSLKVSSQVAQKRIEAIRGNRRAVASGAAKLAGAGAALYYGTKALTGVKAARGQE